MTYRQLCLVEAFCLDSKNKKTYRQSGEAVLDFLGYPHRGSNTVKFMSVSNRAKSKTPDSWEDSLPPSERRQRPNLLRTKWEPPKIETIKEWANRIGSSEGYPKPILIVEGPTPAHRSEIYRWVNTKEELPKWIEQGLVENLTDRISKIRAKGSITSFEWDLIWNFLTIEDFTVEEPLRTLLDQGLWLTEAFKAIWEARFSLDEGKEVKVFVDALSHWMTATPLTSEERTVLEGLGIDREIETTFERLDMLFFVMVLAHQNNLIDPIVFTIDGLERALTQGLNKRRMILKDLYDFCLTSERWAKLGLPVGFLIGYSNEHNALESFEKSNIKLYQKIKKYLT